MRIAFAGAVDFSAHCLRELFAMHADVAGVFNPPPSAAPNSDYADLGPLAAANGVPLFRVARLSEAAAVSQLRTLAPDVLFVFGLSELVSRDVLEIPPLGCLGTHPALLPEHRGRHPLIWTLVNGLTEGGLTFFFLDQGVDSGDIAWQRAFPVAPDDDAGTLYERIKQLASVALREIVPQLAAGTLTRRPQQDADATHWRHRTPADGVIDWCGEARVAYNLVRALARPYPGAHTFRADHLVRVWRSRLADTTVAGIAGTVIERTASGILVQCGAGYLELLDWEAGGRPIEVGDRFTTP